MMPGSGRKKKTIGRVERVDLPEWALSGFQAKVDTGAYTSSLHCEEIHPDIEGKTLSFYVPLPSGESSDDQTTDSLQQRQLVHARQIDLRRVKSSNGIVEERFVVQTDIVIAGERHPIELTLTDRSDMRYPVLLGRRFLRNRFLVDVSERYLH